MAKSKQSSIDEMDVINLDKPNAITDQERENLRMQLNDSNECMTKTNKKAM